MFGCIYLDLNSSKVARNWNRANIHLRQLSRAITHFSVKNFFSRLLENYNNACEISLKLADCLFLDNFVCCYVSQSLYLLKNFGCRVFLKIHFFFAEIMTRVQFFANQCERIIWWLYKKAIAAFKTNEILKSPADCKPSFCQIHNFGILLLDKQLFCSEMLTD